MSEINQNSLPPKLKALQDATLEIEKYVSKGGWDAPIRVFALINVQKAASQDPQLAEKLALDIEKNTSDFTLFSVEQENLPSTKSIEELLGKIYWPQSVDGVAISLERAILPSSAEISVPESENEALKFVENHPQRQDVRMVAARMRDGSSWGALRMRAHDKDKMVLSGEKLLEGLCDALAVTFADFSTK